MAKLEAWLLRNTSVASSEAIQTNHFLLTLSFLISSSTAGSGCGEQWTNILFYKQSRDFQAVSGQVRPCSENIASD